MMSFNAQDPSLCYCVHDFYFCPRQYCLLCAKIYTHLGSGKGGIGDEFEDAWHVVELLISPF